MQCDERTFLGNHIVPRSLSDFAWAFFFVSIFIILIKNIPPDSHTIPLVFLIGMTISLIASGISFGIGVANLIAPILISPFRYLIKRDARKIEEMQSIHSWPGRQILDEIRSSQHAVLKRKFLSAGLDTSLSLPKHYDQELIGQQFSLFQSIERVLLAKECNDLAEIVHKAKNIIFNFFRLTRLKKILEGAIYTFIPILFVYYAATHINEIFNLQILKPLLESDLYKEILTIKSFITPLTLIVVSPYIVYLVGNILFLMAWGIVQKTKSQIDDILLLSGSWFIAGAIGVVVLILANHPLNQQIDDKNKKEATSTEINKADAKQNNNLPKKYKKLFNTFSLLISPMPYPGEKEYSLCNSLEKPSKKVNPEDKATTPKPQEIQERINLSNRCFDYKTFQDSYLLGIPKTPLFFIKAFVVLWITYILILILRMSCNRIFRKIASKTIQKHDDMAIEIIRIFGTFLVAAIGLGWTMLILLSHYQGSPAVDVGANSLMPYAILVGVAGTILGIGSRDLLDNFFAGISLQIDRPFELGERIILKTGEVCEVRSIGMRSTHFYNISEHADMFVPNTELAKQTVTNLSRPDRQYRRTVKFYISTEINNKAVQKNDLTALELAEGAVLLAAYSVEGIDIPTVLDQELEASSFYKSRNSIVAEYQHIQERFDEFMNAQFKFEGSFQPVSDVVEKNAYAASLSIQKLNKSKLFRWDYLTAKVKKKNENIEWLVNECKLARQISYNLFKLATCFYTLGATYPTLKSELEPLSLEILRAPTVRSRHIISESGTSLWEIELLVYAQLTEQSGEILHHMNIMINRYLVDLGLSPDEKNREIKK